MKRIFLISAMIISSFGMVGLQTISAAPMQQSANPNATLYAKAKTLVSKINIAVGGLHGAQFSQINQVCLDYYQQLDALNAAAPADLASKSAALKATRDSKVKALLQGEQLSKWDGVKE